MIIITMRNFRKFLGRDREQSDEKCESGCEEPETSFATNNIREACWCDLR